MGVFVLIRFCDKEVYNRRRYHKSTASGILFKRQKNRFAVIAVYEKNGVYKGIITYYSLLMSKNMQECIDPDTISISDHFWEKVYSFFTENDSKKLLTVMDVHHNILGFAYNDNTNYELIKYAFAHLRI